MNARGNRIAGPTASSQNQTSNLRNLQVHLRKMGFAVMIFGLTCGLSSARAQQGEDFAYGGADYGQIYSLNGSAAPYSKGAFNWIEAGTYVLSPSQNTIQGQYGTYNPPTAITVNLDETYQFNGPMGFQSNSNYQQFDELLNLVYTATDGTNNVAAITFEADGQVIVANATVAPKYQILSIAYAPPGNGSSNSFMNSQSAGITDSTSDNFTNSKSVSFGGGFLAAFGSIQFSNSTTTGDSTSYTNTYSQGSGASLASGKEDIDHTQDQFFLWINPTVTVTQNGSGTGYYTLGTIDSSGNFMSNPSMDVVNVSVAELENPSTIPVTELEPQTVSPGVTLPGLASVCANPLPPSQCTQGNACGCTAADFAPIVAQDPLAGLTQQSKALNSVDPSRYVYVGDITLEGPATQGGGTVSNNFNVSDSVQACTTQSNGSSYSIGVTKDWKLQTGFALAMASTTDSFTWSQTESYGNCNGASHGSTITEGSNVVGCYADVDVYEDTIYHTFALALPTAPQVPGNSCGFTHQ